MKDTPGNSLLCAIAFTNELRSSLEELKKNMQARGEMVDDGHGRSIDHAITALSYAASTLGHLFGENIGKEPPP